jgi:hypothetical protein
MTDLQTGLRGSAETWRVTPPAPEVPEELLPPKSGSLASRLRAWRHRHLLRERRAEEFFAASRHPDRGCRLLIDERSEPSLRKCCVPDG